MNPLRAHTTPIPTPLWVRLGGSALAGAAVAAGSSRIHFGLALGLSLFFLLAACALVFLHPYRADLRDYAQRHNITMLPNAAQLIPLMALWLMVMFSPLLALPAWGSALVWVLVSGAAFLLFPHVDGSRKLAYAPPCLTPPD